MAKHRKIAVADCETDPFSSTLRLAGKFPVPFLWGWYDGKSYKSFPTTAQFVEFISEREEILYAHNGGKFDWHFLLPDLNVYDEITIINGRIARARIGKCELRDSFNLIPEALSKYKKDEIDYSIMAEGERDKPENAAAIRAYLRSDCVYLYELVSTFISEYGLNLTLASSAMKVWRGMSAGGIPKTTKQFYEFFSPYYFGGRVQCFEKGVINDNFAVYDINSAYPFAMLHEHPYSGTYRHREGFIADADFYHIRARSLGAFAYRSPGLSFPSDGDIREFYATKWELEAAEETRTLESCDILESIKFESYTNFAEYIDHFYELRLQAKAAKDKGRDLIYKRMMNALYGKWAANPENYSEYRIAEFRDVPGFAALGWSFGGELGPWALAEAPLRQERQRYYNVATGASITGFVRAMLWRAICSSKGVMYCDTDSLAVRAPGTQVKIGAKLGEWKHEGDFIRAGIGGKKLYIFEQANGETKAASKGVRLVSADLWKIARGEIVVYDSDVPSFSAIRAPSYLSREIQMTA